MRKEMWDPDDGSAVPPEIGMPGANASVPNSRRDMQVWTLPATAVPPTAFMHGPDLNDNRLSRNT